MARHERLIRGTYGEALVVLSRSEIRHAQRITQTTPLQTDDGQVIGRPGDVQITAYKEQYPIKAEIFYGAYEVLGSVGEQMVARRLMHVRRAWPITSDDAVFSYGPGRGEVPIARGAWLYQSDDEDLGVINSEVKDQGHAEVAPESAQGGRDWALLFRVSATALTFLPTLLTALGLLAFVAYAVCHDPGLSKGLLAAETLLLLAGTGLLTWMRWQRWLLRAAVQEGSRLEVAFQCAVRLLGHRASAAFPGMALWRAAQVPLSEPPEQRLARGDIDVDAELAELTQQMGKHQAVLRHELHSHHRTEQIAFCAGLAALLLIIAFNGWLLFASHSVPLEVMVVWLPSLIAALHAHNQRRQISQRAGGTRELLTQLKFIGESVHAEISGGSASLLADTEACKRLEAALVVLCKTIGSHTQARWRLALAELPELPV